MSVRQTYRLKVQQVEQACLFDLSWGKGQQLSAQVSYPEALEAAYATWVRCYLFFYKNLSLDAATELRGKLKATGRITPVGVDWQAELVQAEAELLQQLHHWLRSAELYEIRSAIRQPADLLLVCEPLSLARLPWEMWDLGNVRIARCPANVRATSNRSPHQRRRVRVLAILGDEKGLDFAADRAAVKALAPKAEVQFVGWQPGLSIPELKRQICDAISDPLGWDILFFAGHSNETNLTGGELAIAPNTLITIKEIAPHLKQLQEKGLQLAIFNSCSGLSIAISLIDLGLSQVAVMREPIHNRVAQVFLGRFLKHLNSYQDAHDALCSAVVGLQHEENLSYPSAHLIPSFFRHPESKPFRLQPMGIRQYIRPWLPTRREAVTLAILIVLSLWPSLQRTLLDQRILAQSVYRMLTDQIPAQTTPPLTLVQIDDASIQKAGIRDPKPMDRAYLAKLVDRLVAHKSQVIGIDYLLDRQQPQSDPLLASAVRSAVAQQNTWLVFASTIQPNGLEIGVNPKTEIASPTWSLQAHIHGQPTHIELPRDDCRQACPFAYLIAMLTAYQENGTGLVGPSLENKKKLKSHFLNDAQQLSEPKLDFIQKQQQAWLSLGSYYLKQQWLDPILDFSIPPEQAYQSIPAWQLLATKQEENLSSVVIVAPGGYKEAGVNQSDNFAIPLALQFWRASLSENDGNLDRAVFTGGEAHAYMVHHLLQKRLVIPIPNLWMVLLMSFLGKVISLRWGYSRPIKWWQILGVGTGTTGIYSLISLQGYLSASVLFPVLLPSMTVLLYLLPLRGRRNHG
ncbi:hypothetical protein C1752_01133 [Acaryochloris thomasi RCC1774]|uniref:CHASE2 domain-containing protein n=1 Tax=Acaryochloris thomasi RCC1774 TaxID=1764569 RepID=A0A2W1K0A5_9CYAN|nr:CHASE2 domain-containing protein [Acaryochloris thomasi]PZD74081.1 hypothetical protein C1752_01133 [Acaryochloris thomasi RCC1774]